MAKPTTDDPGQVDPEEFLRRLLHIRPEDAAKAREAAAKRSGLEGVQEGPTADYGEPSNNEP